MSKKIVGLILAVFFLAGAGAMKARATEVGISLFYDELAPYGEWITLAPYGWVWCPYDVAAGWRPYMDGDWLYSDYGWTFFSPVDWGWAVYHYGRWGYSDVCGWFWVPGTVWGPAWVAWRYGGGFMGWAPLPPEIGWSFGVGLEWGGFDMDFGISWPWWSFCEISRFGGRHLDRYIVNPGRNQVLFRTTRNVTNYRYADNRIINQNINVAEIERARGGKIVRYSIAETPAAGGRHVPMIRGTALQVYKPVVLADRANAAAPRNVLPPRRTSISAPDMQKLHLRESNDLNKRHLAEQKALSSVHRQETPSQGTSGQGASVDELNQRHQAEMKALQEQHRREAQALENRQRREQEQRQAAESQRRQSGSTGQEPRRKNP